MSGWWYINHNGYNVNTDDENEDVNEKDEWWWWWWFLQEEDDDDHDEHDHSHNEEINLRSHHDLEGVDNAQRATHDVNL